MASARVKIGHIAGKRGISMTNAKRYYYEKLDAEARGERLPFYKWAKSNLGYSNVEGDTEEPMGAKPKGMLAKAWKNKQKAFSNRCSSSSGLSFMEKIW